MKDLSEENLPWYNYKYFYYHRWHWCLLAWAADCMTYGLCSLADGSSCMLGLHLIWWPWGPFEIKTERDLVKSQCKVLMWGKSFFFLLFKWFWLHFWTGLANKGLSSFTLQLTIFFILFIIIFVYLRSKLMWRALWILSGLISWRLCMLGPKGPNSIRLWKSHKCLKEAWSGLLGDWRKFYSNSYKQPNPLEKLSLKQNLKRLFPRLRGT